MNYYYYYLKITGWALTLSFPCLEASYAHKEYMKLLSNTPFINVNHAVSQDHRGVCNSSQNDSIYELNAYENAAITSRKLFGLSGIYGLSACTAVEGNFVETELISYT